jgi:hypothetical protein
MLFTHLPMFNVITYWTLALVVLFFVAYFKKDTTDERAKRWWSFSLVLVLACVVAYSQQIITGRTVWPQHFVQYTKPLAVAVLIIFFHNLIRPRATNLWRAGVVLALAVSALFGWRILTTVGYTIPQYKYTQSLEPVFDYINTHGPKDCVVYVHSDSADPFDQLMNRFLPALTWCNDYHTFYLYNGVPADRIMHNYLVEMRLNGVKLKDVAAYYNKERFYTTSYFFRDWSDILCCQSEPWLTKFADKAEIDRWYIATEKVVEQKYANFLKKDLYSELTQYSPDYFVTDISRHPGINAKNYPFLSLKGKFGNFAVYAVVNPRHY